MRRHLLHTVHLRFDAIHDISDFLQKIEELATAIHQAVAYTTQLDLPSLGLHVRDKASSHSQRFRRPSLPRQERCFISFFALSHAVRDRVYGSVLFHEFAPAYRSRFRR